MAYAYMILSVVSPLAWLGLLLYCSPGAHRVVFGRPRKYDLLATLFVALAFNRLGYSVTALSFLEPERFTPAELVTRLIMAAFALACVGMMIAVLRYYRRSEEPFA